MTIDAVLKGEEEWDIEHGDALEVLRSMPADSVDTILTSPPYWSLRSYLPSDHPDKGKEIGSEPGPGPFLDALLDVIEECYRILAPHGSLFVNLGDTYSGSGGAGGDYAQGGLREGQPAFEGSAWRTRRRPQERLAERFGRALPKSLCGIPQAFMLSLIYGRNPFNGRECKQWRVRNWLTWCKPNPAVGQIIDKWRPGTEPIIFAVKNVKQFFDLQAIRRTPKYGYIDQTRPSALHVNNVPGRAPQTMNPATEEGRINSNPGGAPPLDWWEVVPTQFPGAHFATFPVKLIQDPLIATCPERVCRTCGNPSERITEPTEEHKQYMGADIYGSNRDRARRKREGKCRTEGGAPRINAEYETVGWTECGHEDWRRGIALDPFAGSGTTGVVARRLGRSFIGIELSEEYAVMARERVTRALLPEPKRSRPIERPGQESLL